MNNRLPTVDGADGVRWLITAAISFTFLLPLAYAVSMSFKAPNEAVGEPHFIPQEFQLQHYVYFLTDYSDHFVNSILIAVGGALIILAISIPPAYAFARLEFKWRKELFYLVVMIMLIPHVMIIIPFVQIERWLGLFDTIFGVWIALLITGVPVALWILRDNFSKLPPNIEDAAQVYGCTRFSAFVRVVLPLAGPAIIAVAFLSFLEGWREFLFSNMLTTGAGARPVIVDVFLVVEPDQPIRWGYTMAGSTLVSIPPAIFYLAARRYLQESLDF